MRPKGKNALSVKSREREGKRRRKEKKSLCIIKNESEGGEGVGGRE